MQILGSRTKNSANEKFTKQSDSMGFGGFERLRVVYVRPRGLLVARRAHELPSQAAYT